MGFHFSWKSANWLAHILQPMGTTPTLENDWEARSALKALLDAAPRDFYASPDRHFEFRRAIEQAERHLHDRDIGEVLRPLREHFRDIPWTALLVPSGDWEFDRFLSARELLRDLVHIRPSDPGLILQIDESLNDDRRLELDNLFPAFRVAMANATRWPGVLLWTPHGDAAFFELERNVPDARHSLEWLFSHLSVMPGVPDLELLRSQFVERFGPSVDHVPPLRIIHLSDLHLGSRIAKRRLPRVKQLIQQLAADLGESAPILPVVTGDLMDTPDDSHLDAVRDFLEFLHNVGSEDPIVVLGNHDVRKDGWLGAELQNALRIQVDRVRWIEQCQVGFACFNSVRGGNLARGRIDETEYLDVGQALDRSPEFAREFVLGALLHHHPIPVERPTWYHQPWYERFLGRSFEKTESLESSEEFISWLQARKIGLVLHGHKHIPRVETHEEMTIVGCGSTVGKVETYRPGTTYMSMNVVTVDAPRGRISCRLRAERIPGGGMTSDEQHEAILNSKVFQAPHGAA
jgi:3',5'-cyclic AMP phosphodiesterase CpdA